MNRPAKHRRVRGGRRLVVLGVLVMTLAVLGRILPFGRWLSGLVDALRGAGAWGMALFLFAYTPAALFFVPSALLTFAAGFAYGALLGTLLAIPAIAISAWAVFLLTRTVLREWVVDWLARDPRFVALDGLLTRFGPKAVVLLRFSPVSPFSILNFAFGLTGMKSHHYFIASAIGAIPGAAFYAQLGALAPHLDAIVQGRLPEGGRTQTVFLAFGLCLTVAVAVWLGRMAKAALADSAKTPSDGDSDSGVGSSA
ncbi:MAG: VTT domain-containing protein [Polyangiaceae bacterium]